MRNNAVEHVVDVADLTEKLRSEALLRGVRILWSDSSNRLGGTLGLGSSRLIMGDPGRELSTWRHIVLVYLWLGLQTCSG